MKPYKLKVSVTIVQDDNDYSPTKKVDFSFDERIPEGVEPVKYMRQRLSEEVKRHCESVEFDWQKESEEYDELESGTPEPIKPPISNHPF